MSEYDRLKAQSDEIKRTERLAREVEICAHLEAGVRGTGKPTDVYPDWVYEARDAIRRQDDNPPHYLPELLAILGWSGGTYHQALKAIQRLVAMDKDRAEDAQLALQQLDWQCPKCGRPAKSTTAMTPKGVLTATIVCERGHANRPERETWDDGET